MNKYKVEFNLNAQKKGKPKYDFIFGQTENSALSDASIARDQIVAIYLLGEEALVPGQTYVGGPVDFQNPVEDRPKSPDEPSVERTSESPVDETPTETLIFDSASSADLSGTQSGDLSGGDSNSGSAGSDLN